MVSFELGEEIEKDVSSCRHEGGTKKMLSLQEDSEFFLHPSLVTDEKTSSFISFILFEQLKYEN